MHKLFLKVTDLLNRAKREEGQGLVEYALILVLVSIAAIVALGLIGTNITTILNTISDHLNPVH
jgi:pilus assembly protein Flp/PilA